MTSAILTVLVSSCPWNWTVQGQRGGGWRQLEIQTLTSFSWLYFHFTSLCGCFRVKVTRGTHSKVFVSGRILQAWLLILTLNSRDITLSCQPRLKLYLKNLCEEEETFAPALFLWNPLTCNSRKEGSKEKLNCFTM